MEEILHHLGYINLVNNGRNYISTGAGFQPSTVCLKYNATFSQSTEVVQIPRCVYLNRPLESKDFHI